MDFFTTIFFEIGFAYFFIRVIGFVFRVLLYEAAQDETDEIGDFIELSGVVGPPEADEEGKIFGEP